MCRNGTQVEYYASDDLILDLDRLCIDYYIIAKANCIILYKCLHLYILLCVNNYQLNVYGYIISISQTEVELTVIIIVLLVGGLF